MYCQSHAQLRNYNYVIKFIFVLLVGRQFLIAEDILFTGGYPSYGDSLEAGIQCFLLAIEVSSMHVKIYQ